jgi:hypothetical protein
LERSIKKRGVEAMKEGIRRAKVIAELSDIKSNTISTDLYGVEIVGKIAYTNFLGNTSVYHRKYRDNDFVDSKEKCLEYIESKGITEIYGVLTDEINH